MFDWLKNDKGYNLPSNDTPTFTDWLSKNGVSSELYNSYSDDVKNSIGTSYNNLYGTPSIDTSTKGLGFLKNQSIGDYATAAGTLVGIYDNNFGTGKEIRKANLNGINKNIELMDQQIASNKQTIKDKQAFNDTWANASGNVFSSKGSGLGSIKVG